MKFKKGDLIRVKVGTHSKGIILNGYKHYYYKHYFIYWIDYGYFAGQTKRYIEDYFETF